MTLNHYFVGARLFIGGEACTIRYIGSIPQWPDDTAIGVEWDNLSKGKNNGSVKGVQYFTTFQNRNIGSFFKLQKVLKSESPKRRLFAKALLAKYADLSIKNADISKIQFGSKKIESYGFDQWMAVNANVENLKVVSLDKEGVYDTDLLNDSAERPSPTGASTPDKDYYNLENYIQLTFQVYNSNSIQSHGITIFPKLENLDLSSSLFNSTYQVLKILLQVPNLEILNVSNNVFANDDLFLNSLIFNKSLGSIATKFFKNYLTKLKTIRFLNTRLRKSTFILILLFFPNLSELDISRNFLGDDWFNVDYVSEYLSNESDSTIQSMQDAALIWQENQQVFGDALTIEKTHSNTFTIKINFLQFMLLNKNLKALQILNLSDNGFTRFPWILVDVFLNFSIIDLNLSDNQISFLKNDGSDSELKAPQYYDTAKHQHEINPEILKFNDLELNWQWPGLQKLNLNRNKICSYQELDIINLKFPNLKEIRLTDIELYGTEKNRLESKFNELHKNKNIADLTNPELSISLLGSQTLEEFVINEIFFNIIFRFNDSLTMLNKSKILSDERDNSELYFISKFRDVGSQIISHKSHFSEFKFSFYGNQRLRHLLMKYNVALDVEASSGSRAQNGNGSQFSVSRDCLKSNLVELKLRYHSTRSATLPNTVKAQNEHAASSETTTVIKNCHFFKNTTILKFKGALKELFGFYSVLQIRLFFTLSFDSDVHLLSNDNSETKKRNQGTIYKVEEINNNQYELAQYGFENGDTIDIYFVDF